MASSPTSWARPRPQTSRATLAELMDGVQGGDARLVCILSEGQLVGLVDLDAITGFLRIQAALGRR